MHSSSLHFIYYVLLSLMPSEETDFAKVNLFAGTNTDHLIFCT